MKIITVINDTRHPGFNLLRLSCAVNKLDLVVLVSDKKQFDSNRIKDGLLKNYLDRQISDDEIIFFTDGNDALLMCSEEEMLDKYYKAGKELVFSAESGCWPDEGLAQRYPPAATQYRYLNSGGFIGKAGVVKKLLADDGWQDQNHIKSNQYLWVKRYFTHPDKIMLDTGCSIFHTFSPEVGECYTQAQKGLNILPYYLSMKQWFNANFSIRKGRIYSKITGTCPCQVHFNGPSKVLIDTEIIDMLFGSISGSRAAKFVTAMPD